ncbi:zinc finger protein 568-like [Contarinia nasturtii]|uniref:zinc finger protein 568-like n=1 Tax=Contarinia nasturtii TaxID=265458 RepID=UPI0012D41752|nr:zinc finger protein 568-like [Contarinia nasturtii]
MGEHWEKVLDNYWFNILCTTQTSLGLVEKAFQCSAISFDENFKEIFLRATNDWVTKAYELYLTKTKLKEQLIGVRGGNAPSNHNLDKDKTTTDTSGEIVINGSCSCHRPELGTAQSTYKITHGNGRGDGSAICVTIIISNQPADDPKTSQEVNVLVNRTESDGAMDDTESMPTTTNGIDVSEDNTGNDASNKGTTSDSMTTDETSPVIGELTEVNTVDVQEDEPIHFDLPNGMTIDERIDLISENTVEPSENIDSEMDGNEAQEVTTNEPATEPITAVVREEINEVTDHQYENNAMDEPQLLPSDTTESDQNEENIGNGKISDGTTNEMIGTNEAGRDISELDQVNEIDALEAEAIHIDIENGTIVDDLTHETAAASLENIGNQINQNTAQKKTTNQRRKRKIADASTSNGNSKKKRKIATRSTLKTIRESISESPLIDLTFDDAERLQQSNNVDIQSGERSESNSNGAEQQNGSASNGKSKTNCEFCNYVAPSASKLIRHRSIHTSEKPFECNICAKGFTRKDNLKAHMMRIHTGELPFKCNICAKRFAEKNTLKKHMRTHAKQFPFQCSICRQGFTAKRTKETHEKNCNPRRYECYLCKYSTLHKSSLVSHMCIHTVGRPFRCSHCSKRFARKSDLESHLRRLNDKAKEQVEKLFTAEERLESETNSNCVEQPKESTSGVKSKTKCEFCNYVAKYPANLIVHRRIHTGEKPFECNICAKGFIQKQHLERHMKTHGNQFPFHCSICRQGFTVQRTKIAHEKNCSRQLFECYLCKYDTVRKGSLVYHMRKHTVSFRCSHCARLFSTKASLKSHLKRLNEYCINEVTE